ncbi:MAG: N-6 DNA methylase, partial [Lentisphaerota bacterium]
SDEGLNDFLTQVLENCLYGIDKDPRATRLARLNLFLRITDNPRKLPELQILERDSLVSDPDVKEGFIFERDFPLVHDEGGFDVVLGNPPWDKWKPNSKEFFEECDPGFKSLTTQDAKKRMQELMRKRPYLKKEWVAKLEEFEAYSTYYREHYAWQRTEVDGKQAGGDLDLYKIFTERAWQLAKKGGAVGFVVPSGIYTDLGAKGLRKLLFEKCSIKGMYGFENRKFIFPDIDQRYKFVLLAFDKKGRTDTFPCAFFLYTKQDLENALKNPTVLSVEFIKRSAPSAWNILEIQSEKDQGINRVSFRNIDGKASLHRNSQGSS